MEYTYPLAGLPFSKKIIFQAALTVTLSSKVQTILITMFTITKLQMQEGKEYFLFIVKNFSSLKMKFVIIIMEF